MKKKLLSLFIVIASLTLSFGTYASAASLGEVSQSNIEPRAAICSNCGIGTMIQSTIFQKTYFDHNEICSIRIDCIITVMRNEYFNSSKCNNCGVGGSWTSSTYTRTHSKYHL